MLISRVLFHPAFEVLGVNLGKNNIEMSNFIKNKGAQIISRHIEHGIGNPEAVISEVTSQLYDIRSEKDRIELLTMILEANERVYAKHREVCKNPKTCTINQEHEEVEYFLGQELEDLGITIDEDTFTADEKNTLNNVLDEILSQLKDLKDGQQVIYEDLLDEINDLKNWYVLGKKKWKALYIGKVSEMVTAGIIGEAVSKPLLEAIKELPKLIAG